MLLNLLLLAACETPCAEGYGMTADGVCDRLATGRRPGDQPDDTEDSDAPIDTEDTDTGFEMDFGEGMAEVHEVMMARCGPCHTNGKESGRFGYSGWSSMVNVPSHSVAGMDLVEPGSRQNSYLWHKVAGTHMDVGGKGQQMPSPNEPLSSGELDIIGTWIDEGAEY